MSQHGVPESQTSKHNETVDKEAKLETAQHGFPEKTIYEHFEMFERDTKAERDGKSYGTFNEQILKAKKDSALGKVCKGIFVGNILLKNAREVKHPYLLAHSEDFIIIVPYGPIQSVVHTMAIPKIPLYNAVSFGMENTLLIQRMQAALVKVVTDVLTPDSVPQMLYLRALNEAIDMDSNDVRSVRITQERNKLNTVNMSGAEASEIVRKMLKDYYDDKKAKGIPLEQMVCTDLHLHPTNSVGQLHMHGWIAEPSLITDNGMKLEFKNTPVDRIIPVLSDLRGEKLQPRMFKVKVKNQDLH